MPDCCRAGLDDPSSRFCRTPCVASRNAAEDDLAALKNGARAHQLVELLPPAQSRRTEHKRRRAERLADTEAA